MIDRILRYIPKGILFIVIMLFIYVAARDIRRAIAFGDATNPARAKAEELVKQVERNLGLPRFAPPPRDASQVTAKALTNWTNIPPGNDFASYDFYPR